MRDGEVDEKRLDDMVRRVLAILERTGALDDPDVRARGVRSTTPSTVTSRVAPRPGSFVLLQNRGGALPLDTHARRSR